LEDFAKKALFDAPTRPQPTRHLALSSSQQESAQHDEKKVQ